MKRGRPGRCFPAQLTVGASATLLHCHTATLLRCRRLKPGRWSELPDTCQQHQWARVTVWLMERGFLPCSHMLVYPGRLCQEAGPMASLFSLPGAAHSFLPYLAQISTTEQDPEQAPKRVIHASSYSIQCPAVPVNSDLWVDRSSWSTLLDILLDGDANSGYLGCFY